MLDEKDLRSIKNIVKEETGLLRQEFKEDLKSTTDSLRQEFNVDLVNELKPIKTDLAKVRRDVDVMLDFFDREYLNLRARVERIESVLNLKPLATSV